MVHGETGSLPSRWDVYARRLPSSLEDLRGPAAGVDELPLHVARPGRRMYDLGLRRLLGAHARREWERQHITTARRGQRLLERRLRGIRAR